MTLADDLKHTSGLPAKGREHSLFLVPRPAMDRDVRAFLVDCQARNLSANTLRIYGVGLRAFQSWVGQCQAADVTTFQIRQYLVEMQSTHNAGGVHGAYRVLKTFFHWLVVEGDIAQSPLVNVRAPRLPLDPLEPVPLSDVQKMLEVCGGRSFQADRDRAILLALLDTGCRASEFLALNMDDLDLTTGTVIIRRGKGAKFRTAFLGAKVRRELMRYLRHRKESGPLWLTVSGRRLSYAGLREIMRRRAAEAGVPVPGLHSFRRAFALGCLRANMDVYSLQKLMGHADLSVMLRYLRQTDDDLRAAHARSGPVDHLLGGGGSGAK